MMGSLLLERAPLGCYAMLWLIYVQYFDPKAPKVVTSITVQSGRVGSTINTTGFDGWPVLQRKVVIYSGK